MPSVYKVTAHVTCRWALLSSSFWMSKWAQCREVMPGSCRKKVQLSVDGRNHTALYILYWEENKLLS